MRGTSGKPARRPSICVDSIDQNHCWRREHLRRSTARTADSATFPADRAAWVKRLDEMQALQPKTVVPGHQAGAYDLSPRVIEQTRTYLLTFEQNLKKVKNSGQLDRRHETGVSEAVRRGLARTVRKSGHRRDEVVRQHKDDGLNKPPSPQCGVGAY